MHLVEFQLLSNHQFVYINADTVTAIYADTSRDGKKGTKIHTTDGDFTMVEEDLNRVLYALDSAVHPEDYPTEDEDEEESRPLPEDYPTEDEEEPRPLPDVTAAKAAARILKRFCSKSLCGNCIFHESDFRCTIKGDYPIYWDIPKGDE